MSRTVSSSGSSRMACRNASWSIIEGLLPSLPLWTNTTQPGEFARELGLRSEPLLTAEAAEVAVISNPTTSDSNVCFLMGHLKGKSTKIERSGKQEATPPGGAAAPRTSHAATPAVLRPAREPRLGPPAPRQRSEGPGRR